MELRELFYDGGLFPGYYINTNGELFSTRLVGTNRFNCHIKQLVCYGGEMRKVEGTLMGKYTHYRVGTKFTHKHETTNLHKGKRCKNLTVPAHRAVMETFCPLEDNLPDDLLNEWPKLSETVKKYLSRSMVVDHINPNLKEGFNNLSNLQWMTLFENSSKGNRVPKEPNELEKQLWN